MPLFLYRLLHLLLSPVLVLVIAMRLFKGREDWSRFAERLGGGKAQRPAGPLVWFHGASMGECISLLPTIRFLRTERPEVNLLLTSGTRTGMKMWEKNAPTLGGTGQTVTQYVPLDFGFATRRFFKRWKPDLSVFTESDFWPNLLAYAPNPVLLNGRISDRSWPKYQKWTWFFRPLIKRFTRVLAQRSEDATRLRFLGAQNVSIGGNLKFDAEPLPVDEALLEKFRAQIGARPTLVYASTHPGEEEIAAHIHMMLKPQLPELLTIVVPRHPHRGTQAANEALRHTRAVHRRGTGDVPTLGGIKHTDVYVADTLGELGLWYRLAHVTVVGGSMVKIGGHNPLEPLKLGTVTHTGPYMFNFQDMVPTLTEKGLLTVAKNEKDFVTPMARALLADLTTPAATATRKAHIRSTMPSLGGASKMAAQLIASALPQS